MTIEPLTDKDYWNFLISYGKNASTYKIVWGKVLSDLGRINSDRQIRLSELSEQLFNEYEKRTNENLFLVDVTGKD